MITFDDAKKIALNYIGTLNDHNPSAQYFIDPDVDIVENDEVYAFGEFYTDEDGNKRRPYGSGIYTINKETGELKEEVLSPLFPNISIKGLHPIQDK